MGCGCDMSGGVVGDFKRGRWPKLFWISEIILKKFGIGLRFFYIGVKIKLNYLRWRMVSGLVRYGIYRLESRVLGL